MLVSVHVLSVTFLIAKPMDSFLGTSITKFTLRVDFL